MCSIISAIDSCGLSDPDGNSRDSFTIIRTLYLALIGMEFGIEVGMILVTA
jgi:hypothetical protein